MGITESEILLGIVKVVLGGIAAFLAIMLWSRTREPSWMCVVAGAVTGYAGIVYELLVKLGIVIARDFVVPMTGVLVSSLVFTVLPMVFVILALVLMLFKSR
ncbi:MULTISPECIES: hypothetical protein [Treponema]|uniref:Uncharacterized protein n=1 Tax=Treponema saccharophilum DSM 2985 TaxID=907348 RepID=H7EJP7_9SPIR|nr:MULTISPECIES: hypothetical protein [Treponema]EIC02167.1 hypothetical protein TresaDRAFT_2147 [Treponema saccharophilum DSM 2985]MBQ5537613.1 hypothetical protein [Treponema sp.]BDC96709.1 hypothetical protein TRSA_18080 [Treponema saccharophilum]